MPLARIPTGIPDAHRVGPHGSQRREQGMRSSIDRRRRAVLKAGAASAIAAGFAGPARAADDKILIGFWPIASGLPLYVGLERGIFKEAGLQVEGAKFASAQQVAEAMIAGRVHGSANGTASAALGL